MSKKGMNGQIYPDYIIKTALIGRIVFKDGRKISNKLKVYIVNINDIVKRNSLMTKIGVFRANDAFKKFTISNYSRDYSI